MNKTINNKILRMSIRYISLIPPIFIDGNFVMSKMLVPKIRYKGINTQLFLNTIEVTMRAKISNNKRFTASGNDTIVIITAHQIVINSKSNPLSDTPAIIFENMRVLFNS